MINKILFISLILLGFMSLKYLRVKRDYDELLAKTEQVDSTGINILKVDTNEVEN